MAVKKADFRSSYSVVPYAARFSAFVLGEEPGVPAKGPPRQPEALVVHRADGGDREARGAGARNVEDRERVGPGVEESAARYVSPRSATAAV